MKIVAKENLPIPPYDNHFQMLNFFRKYKQGHKYKEAYGWYFEYSKYGGMGWYADPTVVKPKEYTMGDMRVMAENCSVMLNDLLAELGYLFYVKFFVNGSPHSCYLQNFVYDEVGECILSGNVPTFKGGTMQEIAEKLAELEKDIDMVVKNKYDLNVSENLINIINVYASADAKYAYEHGLE